MKRANKEPVLKIVIAGNHAQYRSYMRETGESPRYSRYISHVDQVRGLRNFEIVRYGEWWKNPIIHNPEFQYLLVLANTNYSYDPPPVRKSAYDWLLMVWNWIIKKVVK